MTTSIQPWLIQCLKRKFLKSFLQLLELNCMAVQEKQLYLREGSRPKIEPCLNMLCLSDIFRFFYLLHSSSVYKQPNRPLLLILHSNEIGNSLIIRKYSCKTSLFTVIDEGTSVFWKAIKRNSWCFVHVQPVGSCKENLTILCRRVRASCTSSCWNRK